MFLRQLRGLFHYPSENKSPNKSQSLWLPKKNQNSYQPKQPLVGFRAWNEVDGTLRGPRYDDFIWERRTISEGKCVKRSHRPPARACGCGLWAKWRLEETLGYGWIRGAMLGWGRVKRHGNEGFRCQYAQIIGFLEPEDNLKITNSLSYVINSRKSEVQRLSELYDVPMLKAEKLKEFALSQGITFSQLEDNK